MRRDTQMVGVVMTINAIKHFDGHSEKAGRLPFVDAILHEPGCRSVAQCVGTDTSGHLCQAHSRLERSFHGLYRQSVPFHEILVDDSF